MNINVTADISTAIRRLQAIHRDQIPFSIAVALTKTAQAIQGQIPAMLEKDLDRPTAFTKSGTFVARASKTKLRAEVGFRPIQSRYLRWQVEGGSRSPTRKALRLPSEQPLNAYGNLPAGTIRTLVSRAVKGRKLTKRQGLKLRVSSKVEIFYGDPGDGRPPGLYKRVPLPGGGANRLVPLVVFPAQPARYRKRFDFYGRAEKIAKLSIVAEFDRAMRQAIATAR